MTNCDPLALDVTAFARSLGDLPLQLEGVHKRMLHRLQCKHVFRWDRCGRKGQLCQVTARGAMNSCRVEFPDGFVMITSRNAIRRAKADDFRVRLWRRKTTRK